MILIFSPSFPQQGLATLLLTGIICNRSYLQPFSSFQYVLLLNICAFWSSFHKNCASHKLQTTNSPFVGNEIFISMLVKNSCWLERKKTKMLENNQSRVTVEALSFNMMLSTNWSVNGGVYTRSHFVHDLHHFSWKTKEILRRMNAGSSFYLLWFQGNTGSGLSRSGSLGIVLGS
jgi:hypothetical protein